jgi:hypothetical protein
MHGVLGGCAISMFNSNEILFHPIPSTYFEELWDHPVCLNKKIVLCAVSSCDDAMSSQNDNSRRHKPHNSLWCMLSRIKEQIRNSIKILVFDFSNWWSPIEDLEPLSLCKLRYDPTTFSIMILNPLSRLKVASETITKSPISLVFPSEYFRDGTVRSIQEFVARTPEAVNRRKSENIVPGAPNDPVCRLFR